MLKLLTLLLLIPMFCSAQCRYEFIGMKYNQNKTISLNVGELHSDGNYSGLQATMPLFGSHVFMANIELGKGFGIIKSWEREHIGFVGYGIVGLYVSDFGVGNGNWQLNYGAGFTGFFKGISVGINYTNKERLGFKVGIYFDSYDY